MNSHLIGWLAAGVTLAAGVGALYWYLKRRKAQGQAEVGPEPSAPPRDSSEGEAADGRPSDAYEDATPDSQKDNPDPTRNLPAFDFLDRENLPQALVQSIDDSFGEGWNVTEQIVDDLEPDDVVLFAVESEPTGPYTRTVKEVLTGHVLSVDEDEIDVRVMGPVKHSEHFGNIAGHGLRPGKRATVPKSKILIAAVEQHGDGYDGRGPSSAEFKPSSLSKRKYVVHRGTPYDLKLPYRTDELEWHTSPEEAKPEHVGEEGLLEQVIFPEGAPTGTVIVRAFDNDPEVGQVLVGRWEFKLAS